MGKLCCCFFYYFSPHLSAGTHRKPAGTAALQDLSLVAVMEIFLLYLSTFFPLTSTKTATKLLHRIVCYFYSDHFNILQVHTGQF